jgi:hypothetical protein
MIAPFFMSLRANEVSEAIHVCHSEGEARRISDLPAGKAGIPRFAQDDTSRRIASASKWRASQ